MRMVGFIAVFLFALASSAETLRQVLKTNGIPESRFSSSELDGEVSAAADVKGTRVLLVYLRVEKDNILTRDPQLVQFDRDSGAVARLELKPEDTDLCCGSPNGVEFVGDFSILSFHINPSAAAMLVLGKDLQLLTTLYGFDVREVAPGQLVFVENMIHFAPVHPERLQLADLRSGKRMELYPPVGDALRAEFAREHAKHMPPHATCMKMNDPCSPDLYDEDIEFVDNDRGGNFVFRVRREALHATEGDHEPDSVLSETALYRYAWRGSEWKYCEEELPQDQTSSREQGLQRNASLKVECVPALPVSPEMSNADFSPFDGHRRN